MGVRQLRADLAPPVHDALLYIDESRSLHQLHVVPQTDVPPELYPCVPEEAVSLRHQPGEAESFDGAVNPGIELPE